MNAAPAPGPGAATPGSATTGTTTGTTAGTTAGTAVDTAGHQMWREEGLWVSDVYLRYVNIAEPAPAPRTAGERGS